MRFFHFFDEDQQNLTLQAWSTNTLENMCTAQGKGVHYPIEQAGVWADCVYQRKSVIHNDYASLLNRKGMPEGHASVIRELIVPVIRDERVMAIIGVGNKSEDYAETDVRVVFELEEMLNEGKLTFPSPRADFLLKIRNGEFEKKWIEHFLCDEIERVLKIPNTLPKPDFKFWDSWILNFYKV